MREGPVVDRSVEVAPGDAAVTCEDECVYIQGQHQLVREGPAVDHSDDLAPEEAAVAHEAAYDHIQRHGQGM